MLEVVFDKNIAAGLRMAKDSRPGDKRFSICAGVYPRGTPPELREPSRQETWVWAGKELGGSSADVAPLFLALDIGDLSGLETGDWDKRRDILRELAGQPPAGWEAAHEKCLAEDWDASMETLRRLRSAGTEPVRVWAAPWCPDDVCSVYFVCSLLRDTETPISVVWAPHIGMVWGKKKRKELRGMGEIAPEALGALASESVLLEPALRQDYADRWRELAAENAPLRAVVNGRLSSVPEDFYDFALRAALPEKPVKMGKVLADALTVRPGVGDGWLHRRLLAMMEAGEVREAVPGNGEHPYSAIIQRVE